MGATQALSINTIVVTVNFLYKHIIIQFGCPLTIVTNQGVDFINDVIRYFIDHFIFKHISSIVYYLQGNGQVESINKAFGTLLTKLINENWNDWDEHLSTLLFSYWTTYKVGTSHTPFQLVYGLHPILPTKYLLAFRPNENVNPTHVWILTNHMLELEKLLEKELIAHDLIASN